MVERFDEAAKKTLSAHYFAAFLFVSYLVYPGVSTTLFQTLRCESFDEPAVIARAHFEVVVSFI